MLQNLSVQQGLKEVDTVTAADYMDDGSRIVLSITIDRRDGSALFDFSGTGTENYGNWYVQCFLNLLNSNVDVAMHPLQ